MEPIKAIIVDDEKRARDVLENLLARFCPDVQVIDRCPDLPQAVEAIGRNRPDVVFLDIQMPQHAGFEIGKFITDIDFELVFVTAHDAYAIRAFECAAVDYLLKPIEIDRLKQAVARVRAQRDRKAQADRLQVLMRELPGKAPLHIVVHERGEQHVIPIEAIVALEALESYCALHTRDRRYVLSKNLKHFETLLQPSEQFVRIHKSWLVSGRHIERYSKSDMAVYLEGGIVAKLSKYKVATLEEALRLV